MDEEELDFDPRIVICEKCGGIVKFRGGGTYECEDCGNIVLDDFGKVKDFLERRGPSNIMEISYATGLERNVVAKLLMDGRIQVLQHTADAKTCVNCGIPINYGKYCSNCAETISHRRANRAKSIKKENESGKMRFVDVEPAKKGRSKKK